MDGCEQSLVDFWDMLDILFCDVFIPGEFLNVALVGCSWVWGTEQSLYQISS